MFNPITRLVTHVIEASRIWPSSKREQFLGECVNIVSRLHIISLEQLQKLKKEQILSRREWQDAHLFQNVYGYSSIELGKEALKKDPALFKDLSEYKRAFNKSLQGPKGVQDYYTEKLGMPVVVLNGHTREERIESTWSLTHDLLQNPDIPDKLKNNGIDSYITGAHGNVYGKYWYGEVYPSNLLCRLLSHKKPVKIKKLLADYKDVVGDNPLIGICSNALPAYRGRLLTAKLWDKEHETEKLLNPDEWQKVSDKFSKEANQPPQSLHERLRKNGFYMDSSNRIFRK